MQCLAKKKDWSEANLYLDQVSGLLEPIAVEVIRGYLAHYQESRQEAERHASEAHALLSSDAIPEAKDFLARLLMVIGKPADALPLWQDLFELDAPGFDPGNLLDCAARLHRDDVVLQACDRLHARGVNDWHLLEFEIQYLQKYNMDAAIERLQAFVNNHPDHRVAQLRLSLIGLLLGKPELVRAHADDLPPVDELPLEYALSAVQVMKFAGDPTAAVDYAYRFLRKHFGEIQAHQALLMSMMPGLSSPNIPPTLEVVGPDAAVCYREIPVGDPRWVVLEDTDSPSRDFEEIVVSCPLAENLIGKRTGDTVVIARGRLQDREATIIQILPKYVRRYQDSMAEMQVRFGAASSVESVRVGGPDDAGGPKGLDILVVSLRQRADAVMGIRERYMSAPLSLHLYGARFGGNAYMAIMDLAQAQNQQVKCSLGTPEERNEAVRSLQTAKALVVDITALAALRMLGLTKVLSSAKYKFITSQRTRITLREMLYKASMFSGAGATLSYEGGRPLVYEETAEEGERRGREDEEFMRFVEGATELRSGVALAALEPSKREVLEKVFGQYGSESMVLASDPDHVLWTDDLLQAQFSAQEFGVRRVWTQLVLGTFADVGLMSSDEYGEASARLIGMEFVATSFDASALLAGFKLAGWAPHRRPAAQFVRVFADPLADWQQLFGLFVSFIERLYREPILPASRFAITRSLLDALGGRPQAMVSLGSLRQLSPRVFGINALGQQQFAECFDLWLKYRDEPLILPA
jgi:transcription elongation GreA/GreB family factor